MAHEYAKGFYASDAWHKCRLGFIRHRRSLDGGLCEECKEKPGYIVHHKRELSPKNINDPSVTLDWSNLEYVCKDCHDKIHEHCGREKRRDRRVVFNEKGEPMLARPEAPSF